MHPLLISNILESDKNRHAMTTKKICQDQIHNIVEKKTIQSLVKDLAKRPDEMQTYDYRYLNLVNAQHFIHSLCSAVKSITFIYLN